MPQMAPLMWLPLLVLNLIMLFLIITFIYFCISPKSMIELSPLSQSKYLNDNKIYLKEDKLFLNKNKWQYQF
nr:TPA_asm: ATP synthase F0 subunit 8 [Pseudomyrmex ferrugineus]